MGFLHESAPKAIRTLKSQQAFTGRVIAIDASMCLYQFLIMIRESGGAYNNLTNEEGEVTSHIVGMLSRTIRLMENGIKPVYVFDGKPPELKLNELRARRERREKGEEEKEEIDKTEDAEKILKNAKLRTKVTREQNEDTKRLLRLMGVPVVEAPSEAEATCAALCRDGKVYAAATEDADCLTFGTSILLRNLMAVESQKKDILEVSLSIALEQLNLTMDQFIDFCILSGCDYCDTVKGIGPATAIKLLMTHGSLEKVLEHLGPEKVPANFPYKEAREFFKECESVPTAEVDFKFDEPDIEGLTKFLVEEKSFNKERVERFMQRLQAVRSKGKQRPLDSFFTRAKVEVKDEDKFDPTKKKARAKLAAGKSAPGGAAKRKAAPAGGPAKRAR